MNKSKDLIELCGLSRSNQLFLKEKYTQLRLPFHFGQINTIGFTQTLCPILKDTADKLFKMIETIYKQD